MTKSQATVPGFFVSLMYKIIIGVKNGVQREYCTLKPA